MLIFPVSSGKAENTIECSLCELVMQKLEDLLEANATEVTQNLMTVLK